MKELQALNRAIDALKILSPEGREYLLDRFYSDAEISAELKRRYQKRIAQHRHESDCSTHSDHALQSDQK